MLEKGEKPLCSHGSSGAVGSPSYRSYGGAEEPSLMELGNRFDGMHGARTSSATSRYLPPVKQESTGSDLLMTGGDDPGAALIDLRPFMNPAVITVQQLCSVSRVYSLFRSLGLRHLAVVDRDNTVKGIITRKELMSTFEKDLF